MYIKKQHLHKDLSVKWLSVNLKLNLTFFQKTVNFYTFYKVRNKKNLTVYTCSSFKSVEDVQWGINLKNNDIV